MAKEEKKVEYTLERFELEPNQQLVITQEKEDGITKTFFELKEKHN